MFEVKKKDDERCHWPKCDQVKGTLMHIWKSAYLRFHMNLICRRFLRTPFTFWDMRTWVTWNVCLQIFRNNRMLKISLLFKKFTNLRIKNSRLLRIRNAKFAKYCFYMNINILNDFHICISVPFTVLYASTVSLSELKTSRDLMTVSYSFYYNSV